MNFTHDTPFEYEGVKIWRLEDVRIRYSHPNLDATVIAPARHAFLEAEPRAVPKVGDYIRAVFADAHTESFEIASVDTTYDGFHADESGSGYYSINAAGFHIHFDRQNTCSQSDWKIVYWSLAEPPKPAHPLADAKPGEWWALTWTRDDFIEVIQITPEILKASEKWDLASARKVYVIPAYEASAIYNSYGNNTYRDLVGRVLDLAL